ncbi:LRC4C protein, partial [Pseudoatta argentina]
MCLIVLVWRWRAALFSTMLLLLSWGTNAAEDCPSMCACKWKGGKEWVECANRDLKGLPQGAREETQVLDLSGNHLVNLPAECFRALGLINLQRIYLGKSRINQIASEAFVGLVGLVELDLSENQIEQVPTDTFASYPSLMRLILNGNPIREIRQSAFLRLMHLTNLEISKCVIEIIEQNAFEGLQSLEWLRLDGNRLTYVPDHTLPLGGNLRGLTLHSNPWQCDCRLRIMQAWLKESAPAAPQESEPICDSPARLHGKQIKSLKINELACLPRIDFQDHLDIYEGGNITLRCDVHAIPTAKVTWWINGEPCELQHENNSMASSISTFPRYIRQRGGTNMSSTLFLYWVESLDEGTYSCIAENSAGSAVANLSLRVLFREKPTVEPPSDNPGSGYVAAIVAGALVGTLLALSCLVGSVIYCAKKRRRDRKRNSKALVTQSKSVLPITKDTTSSSCRKGNGNLIGGLEHQQMVSYTEREINRTATLERREHTRNNHLDRDAYSVASPVAKYLTEPDLINEVPESSEVGYGQLYGRHHQRAGGVDRQVLEYDSGYPLQPDLRPPPVLSQVNYLDQDGYPLNFGLPKITFSTASTLPRLRQRMTEPGSAAAPAARYSREAEFLARSPGYDPILPRTDARYTAEVSPVAAFPEVPFIPSPPAAYRGETTPLSPRSLLGKTAREAAAAAAARAEELQPPNHPESPDEGYVGDAMDV